MRACVYTYASASVFVTHPNVFTARSYHMTYEPHSFTPTPSHLPCSPHPTRTHTLTIQQHARPSSSPLPLTPSSLTPSHAECEKRVL